MKSDNEQTMKLEKLYKLGPIAQSVIASELNFSGCEFKSHSGQLFIATSKNLSK